jgi:hypothetical protein
MQPSNPSHIDWTGVEPDQSPIAPLDECTFTTRLRLLSERATNIMILRNAFKQQHHDADQLSRDPESLLLRNLRR